MVTCGGPFLLPRTEVTCLGFSVQGKAGSAADIWAFGTCLWEVGFASQTFSLKSPPSTSSARPFMRMLSQEPMITYGLLQHQKGKADRSVTSQACL